MNSYVGLRLQTSLPTGQDQDTTATAQSSGTHLFVFHWSDLLETFTFGTFATNKWVVEEEVEEGQQLLGQSAPRGPRGNYLAQSASATQCRHC